MGPIMRYFWPLVGGLTLIAAGSLALRVGLPATVAGLLIGGLLMWREVQLAPAVAVTDDDD